MVANPCCCGCRLQTGVKVIASLEMIGSGLGIIKMMFELLAFFVVLASDDAKVEKEKAIAVQVIGIMVGYLLLYIAYFALGLTLLKGAQQCNVRKCQVWLCFKLIAFVLAFIAFFIFSIVMISNGGGAAGVIVAMIITFFVVMLFYIYIIWVVYAFMGEIQAGSVYPDTGAIFKS